MPTEINDARNVVYDDWADSPYYDMAEDLLPVFWTDDYPFFPLFRKLDLRNCVELACGHGRHTAQILRPDRKFTLIDVNQSNIDFCRTRFVGYDNVTAIKNNGSSLPIADDSVTALFCYDAMVHFELHDVIAYLGESFRVLAPGGKALLHFSNYDKDPGGSYHDNPCWRNFNSASIFSHMAIRAGFEIEDLQTLNWASMIECDAVALLLKP